MFVKNKSFITKACFAAIFVLVIVVFGCINRNYVTGNNLITILRNVSVTAISALGVTFVISVGHTDMSFYLIGCFSPMLMSWMASLGFPPLVSILAGFVGALIFGIISGVSVGVFRLPDIIITIAIGTIAFGCGYLFSDGQKIYDHMDSISFLNNGKLLGLPTPVFFMLLLYIAAYIFLEKTKYGTFFYSVGSNSTAARYSGINVTAVVVMSYILCILLSSFGGMINTAAKGMGDVKQSMTLLMPCFTAVFIGNAIFRRPNVIGTFLGALLIQMMSNGIILIGLEYYIGDLITSVLLVASLLISTINSEGGVTAGRKKTKKECGEAAVK